ncbi:hypothetical protein RhiirA4_550272 [Rhizophagus irregularis]|uniref:Uncharacterized protein n=1 Tax=Rhizophagus irregularis TaxID=588596 RepID=A0A2I1HJV8_9GLOM|nr:hypothetical protein RhiirA4_550272 [Rhizophagus irregularis]
MHSQLLAANRVKKGYYIRKLKENLYKLSDLDDLSFDIYISLIIKSVFASDKERTNENAIWVQSVLEVIFDEEHFLSKIDADIVDSWTGNITDTDVDSEECECESSPKTPITPIDDDDEIIGVDHRVDDVYDEHTTDDNQAADLEVADLEEEQ